MCIFAEELIPIEGAKENFYKLIYNGRCFIDEFWDGILKNGNFENDLDKIQVIIERMSRGEPIPFKCLKELKGRTKGDPIKDYEIRVKKLRIYFFRSEKGKIIVFGALKDAKDQKRDIIKLRMIKKKYMQFSKI